MTENRRSLFKQVERETPSTIYPRRRVSFFAGRVFKGLYGVRNIPNTYTHIFARLIDLQPVIGRSGIEGIRVLYRMCEESGQGQIRPHQDRRIKDLSLGPFDTVVQVPAVATVKEEHGDGEMKIPMGNTASTYAMYKADREPSEEDRFLKLAFRLET